MTHTPGPWQLSNSGNQVFAGGNYVIAIDSKTDGWQYDQDRKANAKLIEAAPDLLAACQEMLAHFSVGGSHTPIGKMLEHARAAIAKATGTTAGNEGHPET